MALDQTLSDCVSDDLGQQCNRADGVVVTRNWVGEVIGVSVGVEDSHNRNSQLLGLVDCEVLAQWVNNPDRAWGLLEVADTAKRLLQLGEFALLQKKFFLGEALGGVFVVDLFQFLHPAKTLGHSLEVGQETTEPTLVNVGLADAGCLLGDCFLSLLLGSHEEDGSTVCNEVLDEVVCTVDVLKRLLKVNDVNATALGEDESLDFRVPAPGLVSEVNAAVEQLADSNDGHGRAPSMVSVDALPGG